MKAIKAVPTRVVVALSGGQSSFVTASLLRSQGFQVHGLHLRLGNESDTVLARFRARCGSRDRSAEVEKFCSKLDIPLTVLDAVQEFKSEIVDNSIHEMLQSRTPNPCARCGTRIVIEHLIKYADEMGCEQVATGHRAQVVRSEVDGVARLRKAVDAKQDQSYFLYRLTQRQLKRLLMPLGGISENMVRKLTADLSIQAPTLLPVSRICFVSEPDCAALVQDCTAPELRPPGTVRSLSGEMIGEHAGLYRYPIGSIPPMNLSVREPEHLKVVGRNPKLNTLVVATEDALLHQEVSASQTSWVSPVDQLKEIKCLARTEPEGPESACIVTLFENSTVQVYFERPHSRMAPGQSIVFYQEDEILGGALIDQVGPRLK